MNQSIKINTAPKGVLITNDNFLIASFKSKVQGEIHDRIDILDSLDNVFINTNSTYYIDNRVINNTISYTKMLEIDLFSGGRVCLMNFKKKRGNTNELNMRMTVMELIKCFKEEEYGRLTSPHCNLSNLTRQEIKVLRFISSGISAHSLAKALNLSVKTIHSHKNSAIKKLGFKNFNAFISATCCYPTNYYTIAKT